MIYAVHVDVALARPPREDDVVRVLVDAGGPVEAQLIACQIAACHRRVVMPVSSRVVSVAAYPVAAKSEP